MFNIENENADKKRVHTHAGQYEIYIAHLEQHEQLRKMGQGDPVKLARLWENLTNELNAFGAGAVRTTAQWQKVLAQWKHSIRHEARVLKKQHQATGGGPATALQLTDIKERALSLLGRAVVDGSNIGRVGRGNCRPAVTFDDIIVEHIDESDADGAIVVVDGATAVVEGAGAAAAADGAGAAAVDEGAGAAADLEGAVGRAAVSDVRVPPTPRRAVPTPRRSAKAHMERIQANDDKVADAICRLADSLGEVSAVLARSQASYDRIIENQDKLLSLLVDKIL